MILYLNTNNIKMLLLKKKVNMMKKKKMKKESDQFIIAIKLPIIH